MYWKGVYGEYLTGSPETKYSGPPLEAQTHFHVSWPKLLPPPGPGSKCCLNGAMPGEKGAATAVLSSRGGIVTRFPVRVVPGRDS